MRTVIFKKVILYNVMIMFGAILLVICLSFRYILNERGKGRVELLSQICESYMDNRLNMVSLMNYSFNDISKVVEDEKKYNNFDQTLNIELAKFQKLSDDMGFDYSYSVYLKNKGTYNSKPFYEDRQKSVIQSYWFIKHLSGESDTSWSLRFPTNEKSSDYGICYAKTIFGENKKAVGVVIINLAPESMIKMYNKLILDGSNIFIIDKNGIVVSHSSPSLIGVLLYDMKSFYQKYDKNNFTINKKQNGIFLLTNYYDEASGWTYVDEESIEQFLFYYGKSVLIIVLFTFALFLVTTIQGYFSIRKISNPIIHFTNHIKKQEQSEYTSTDKKSLYEEIYVLNLEYNNMVKRFKNLICDIKQNEIEKRKIEYDFLQAQIDPHFMHNTLLAIKSLIVLNRANDAKDMLEKFIDFLKVPLTVECQFVTLEQEINMVSSYISIMEYRFKTKIEFNIVASLEILNELVPRMILQPLVGNAIFHGFANRMDNNKITISAFKIEGRLYILVEDNGIGMSFEKIEEILKEDKEKDILCHGIGLDNVRRRIKLLYGNEGDLQIESIVNSGAKITIILSNICEIG